MEHLVAIVPVPFRELQLSKDVHKAVADGKLYLEGHYEVIRKVQSKIHSYSSFTILF